MAGKEQKSGNTRIELWTLAAPRISPSVNADEEWFAPQPVAQVDVVYNATVVGRDMVKAMLRVRGNPSSVFVHFYDSRDLYELDWSKSPCPLSKILSATSEPALAIDAYDMYLAGDHKTKGYVYVFGAEATLGLTPPLVLFDSNRDGIVDWHGAMTLGEYHTQDLAKQSEYYELCGLVY